MRRPGVSVEGSTWLSTSLAVMHREALHVHHMPWHGVVGGREDLLGELVGLIGEYGSLVDPTFSFRLDLHLMLQIVSMFGRGSLRMLLAQLLLHRTMEELLNIRRVRLLGNLPLFEFGQVVEILLALLVQVLGL